MASIVTKTFETAAGVSDGLYVRKGEKFSYAIDYSADWDAGLFLEKTSDGGITYQIIRELAVAYKTDVSETTVYDAAEGLYRFRCIADPGAAGVVTGTAAVTLSEVVNVLHQIADNEGNVIFRVKEDSVDVLKRTSQKRLIQNGAKVGGTAEFLVNAADDKNSLARLPASKTAATLVVPISNLKVGDTITGFHLVGQIESGGQAVTVDAVLRKQTAAASDLVDASVGAITQLSVTADTIMSASNTRKASLSDVVGADETFYVLITATTGSSTDIDLQAVAIEYTEA